MNKPVVLMPEDIQRMMGSDAQKNNITAASMVSEIVKTTLGPKGMDKMLVSPTDDIVVTNDGVTILNEMKIEHPAAKMMVEIAKTQELEIGDGTTSAVMIAGKLLKNAGKLLDMKIHPTIIIKGYKIAAEKTQEILREISFKVTPEEKDVLKQIAMVAMTGKGAEDSKGRLAEIIVKSIMQVDNLEDIKIEKVKGESVKDTELISGVVLDKVKLSHEMPNNIFNAKIALLDFPLELKNPDIETKISVSSPDQLQSFLMQEEKAIKDIVEKIKISGANVVLCQKGIDDFAKYLLTKEGIYACRRVARDDMEKLSKATGAVIVSNLNELTPFELGEAESVKQVKHGEDFMTYVNGCKNPKSLTILIHGGTEHVIDEVERAMMDGLGDVSCVLKSGLIVLGGGAVEIELAKRLRIFAKSLGGRERLAVEEFANALEFIPITLAENAGLDPIDILTELRAAHDADDMNVGLNLFTDKIEDVFKARIIEPYSIKKQAITSASEVATMILRIDDVIASKPNNQKMNYEGKMPDYMGRMN